MFMPEYLVNFVDFSIVIGLRYHLCESESVCVWFVGMFRPHRRGWAEPDLNYEFC